jgi:hypothetical protein
MERINSKRESEVWGNEENVLQLRHWASLRGQTLCRTGSLVILPLSNKHNLAIWHLSHRRDLPCILCLSFLSVLLEYEMRFYLFLQECSRDLPHVLVKMEICSYDCFSL